MEVSETTQFGLKLNSKCKLVEHCLCVLIADDFPSGAICVSVSGYACLFCLTEELPGSGIKHLEQ